MNELMIGKSGEYFACFELLKNGYDAFLSDQGLPFDVVLLHENKIYKIQVKSTVNTGDKDKFTIKFGKSGNRFIYNDKDVDLFAFVNIETKEIAFLLKEETKSIIEIYKSSCKGKQKSEILERNMNSAIAYSKKNSDTDDFIAEKFNISVHTFRKHKNSKNYKSRFNINYYEDYTINRALKLLT